MTGGARRLGAAVCLSFSRRGWGVVCHYQTSAEEALELCNQMHLLNSPAVAVQASLGDQQDRQSLYLKAAAAAKEAGGTLVCLVNNASTFEADEGIDFSVALMERQLGVNLVAPLHLASLLATTAAQSEPAQPYCVINILDQKVLNLNKDYFSYTVSKLALHSATALQAQALAPHTRVCAVAPGLIYVSGPQAQDNFDQTASVNLLKSPTAPKDVADTVVFLAENQSLNGVTLCVDKGQHLVPLERDIMFVAEQLKVR